MQRLAIILPYRNRAQHLEAFVPHLRAYFARDKADRTIPYRVIVVEQDGNAPFNRGALLDIGFLLAEADSDYVCFHDVDYLPVWADYSSVDRPTALVWYGAEMRPIAPGRSDQAVRHDLDSYWSGAVLIPNVQFRQVDGYATCYWGWGYEDVDLKRRFDAAGIAFGRRKGTFQPLQHDHHGFRLDGSRAAISVVNERMFDARWAAGQTPPADGLSTVRYQIMRRQTIPDPRPERAAEWLKVTVRLEGGPNAEQATAVAAGAAADQRGGDRGKPRRR